MAAPLKTKRLLLCEGIDDAEFLRALITKRRLGNFDVRPVKDVGGVAGNSGFRSALIGAVSMTNFRDIQHVALISDGDSHYGNSFKSIVTQIKKANEHPTVAHRYGVPAKSHKIAGGKPSVTVLLLPELNKSGALETLLWRALCSVKACKDATNAVESACKAIGIVGAKGWTPAKQDKARLHAGLALTHEKNPGIPLHILFRRAPKLIPLEHAAFDGLENALKAL